MPRFRPILLVLLPAMSLTGCLSTAPNEGTPVAIIVMNARTKGTGFTTAPVANFYKANAISFASSNSASDSCQGAVYSTGTQTTTAASIGAGATIGVSLSGTNDTLRKVSTTDLTYKLASTAGMTYTPGDTVKFVISGDLSGFFGTSITGRTAEAFTNGTIAPPAAGQSLPITWSPAGDGFSVMVVSLRYNDGTGSGLNTQLFCDFRDDGTGTVQANLIAKWAASSERIAVMQRQRNVIASTSAGQYLNLITTFDRPTPTSP